MEWQARATEGARPNGACADPCALLASLGLAAYDWFIEADRIVWGPSAARSLGSGTTATLASKDAWSHVAAAGWRGGAHAMTTATASSPASARGIPYRFDYVLRPRVGHLLAVDDVGRWWPDAGGRPALARGLIRARPLDPNDPTAHPALAGREAFLAALAGDVAQAVRLRRPLTLLVLDVPDDEPGEGASALSGPLGCVAGLVRRGDRLWHPTPERIVVALRSCSGEAAELALRRRLGRTVDRWTIGAATAPDHALDAAALLLGAERAARSGEAGIVFSRPPTSTPRSRRPDLLGALDALACLNARRVALLTDEAIADAVPALIGVDGLARPAPDLPDLMARTGLAPLFDLRMLELALGHLSDPAHRDTRLSLALTGDALTLPGWVEDAVVRLGAFPSAARRLTLATDEAAVARDPGAAASSLARLRQAGPRTALARYGRGYLAAAALAILPFDEIRLDPVLADAATVWPEARAALRALATTAREPSADVPARIHAIRERTATG